MKNTDRPYIYPLLLMALFLGLIIAVSLNRQRKMKHDMFTFNQMIYTDITEKYITRHQLYPDNLSELAELADIFPKTLRLSILDKNGNIIYDDEIAPDAPKGNSIESPEIKAALEKGSGGSIRKSNTLNENYIYYAEQQQGDYIIRTAYPYINSIKDNLKPDIFYTLMMITLFILFAGFISIYHFTFKKATNKLKNFLSAYILKQEFPSNIKFKDQELREIQRMFVDICKQLEMDEKQILLEKEKLLEHFHHSEEGISFFTPTFENIYTNSHFIQYLSTLSNQASAEAKRLFDIPVFNKLVQFLYNPENERAFEQKISISRNVFQISAIIFDDKSFEIIIRDISEMEKDSFDRSQMTNNIAHELRTPVTSIRGYLETLLDYKNISVDKKYEYLERAYNQTVRLSEIIQDVVLLSKTADAAQYFTMEEVDINKLLEDLFEDAKEIIDKKEVRLDLQLGKNIVVRGSRTLLYSIFWNLLNNAMKYAGENITVSIHNYREDAEFYYFSLYDNGKGIEEKYLDHIFERFYRINEGRTRDKGGSGLGLAIVKDAIKFHHGEIHAKNNPDGGLAFLFTIRKK